MKAALLLFVSVCTLLVQPAMAQDWIALWLHDGAFLGLTEDGDLFRCQPATHGTELVGSIGTGPWVSFGKRGVELLALKSDGEVWTINAYDGVAAPYVTLPSDREWCAVQQHPDVMPSYAISCDGEIWSLWEPVRLLADFGPCAEGRWICIANADDSFFATLESGDARQGTPEWCNPAGAYGPGPWVGFSRTYEPNGGSFIALKSNGEIWAHGWTSPWLLLTMPAGREWCGFLTGPVWGTGPGYALTCSGEIWSVASPPELVGTFELPTAVRRSTWGNVRTTWR